MKKALNGFSTGIPIPKPSVKKNRSRRKRELKKKDKQFQESVPEDATCIAGLKGLEMNIENMHPCVGSIVRHHLIGRRNIDTRHQEGNSLLLCTYHHIEELHRHGQDSFMEKYSL